MTTKIFGIMMMGVMMNELALFSSMEQSRRKSKQAGHCVSFLYWKTDVPYKKLKNWSLRQCIKQAKKLGWNPNEDWRYFKYVRSTKLDLADIFFLAEEIEQQQKYLFVVYPTDNRKIQVDALDWESEEAVDGGHFSSVIEVIKFMNEFK